MRSWLAPLGAVAAVCAAGAGVVPATASARALKVSARPALSPAFATGVSDYVSRCDPGRALKLTIDAPSGVSVGVHGSKPKSGKFTASVALHWGEDANVLVRSSTGRRRYHIRCVQPDFPRWKFKRFGPAPGAQWYLIAPVAVPDGSSPFSHYVTLIDGHGTPVWWRRQSVIPFNSTLLPSGELAWGRWYVAPFGMNPSGGWEVHKLDGTLVRTLRTKGSPTDMHDMEPLPNGNYLLIAYRLRRHVNLTAYGGTADGEVYDGEIQEITAAGKRVWTWNSKDHIGLDEDVNWRTKLKPGEPWDYFHLNSVAPDGDGIVISARHVDAVYRIAHDKAGAVEWKLGGTHRDGQSLALPGGGEAGLFLGQHDARVLADGTLTVFDNHTFHAAPRGVRLEIDATAHTAKVLDEVTEPGATSSAAEGSARRLADGHWVVSWGTTPLISERTASNEPVWLLTLKDAQNYRATPIPQGRLKVTAVRRAMDRMSARRAG